MFRASFPKNCHNLTCLGSWNILFERFPVFDLIQSSTSAKAFSLGVIAKTITGILWLPETLVTVGANSRLIKNLKGKGREWTLHRTFEKLLHFGIWEDTCMVLDCVPAQERPEKALNSHLLLTVRLCARRKWRLRQNHQLPSWLLKTLPNMCTFNEVSVQSLTDHSANQADTSLAHTTKNTNLTEFRKVTKQLL